MTVAFVGGLDRLGKHYRAIAKKENINLKIYSEHMPCLICKLTSFDAVIMFTDKVSHKTAKEVYKLARAEKIRLSCSHRSSLTAARNSLRQVKE